MSETTTQEERAEIRRSAATAELCCLTSIPSLPPSKVTDLLDALEQAEAMVDWLADKMADTLSTDEDGRDVLACPSRTLRPVGHNCDNITCQQCWKEAARRAVAAGEE